MSLLSALKTASTDSEVELALCMCLCEAINTPHSVAVFMALSAGDFLAYKALQPNPQDYLDSQHSVFRGDYLISKMLTKSSDLPTGIDTKLVALDKFAEIEDILQKRACVPPVDEPWMLEVTYELNRVLSGTEPFLTSETLEEVLLLGQLGPGSSTSVGGQFKQSDKLRLPTSVGPMLHQFLGHIKEGQWLCDQPSFRMTPSVEVITVPKTAFTDRTISKVPDADMILQKGLASIIERRLRLFGVDIRDQTRNQNLAKRAYSLKLATIDLSSASSWFSEKNMESIFPADLQHFLGLVRPRYWYTSCELDRGPMRPRWMYNTMPMGCAYTFPLMTAFFYAVVRSIVPRSQLAFCSVYGDDLILPQKYANALVERLEAFGFEVNSKKSYLSGLFFESCGTDWFAGHDVRPFYCRKGHIDTNPIPYRVQLANKLRLWLRQPSGFCNSRYRAIWEALIKPIPKLDLCPVPSHLGDVGLFTSLSESRYSVYEKGVDAGWERLYRIKTLYAPPKKEANEDSFSYLLWLMRRTLPVNQMPFRLWEHSRPDALQTSIDRYFSDYDCTFSKGYETIRGLFGLPRPRYTLVAWDSLDLTWDDRI